MHPLPTKVGLVVPQPAPYEIITLEIQKIRRDGGTQGRIRLNQSVVEDYAELMKAGTEFPPVRVWFDGNNYWLSDGFQRVAAAESLGVAKIQAEVFFGSLEDATWDSYAANSYHGSRRTRADIEAIIDRALQHPKGLQLSNNQIARHLNISEATLRRWRTTSSSSKNGDTGRIAVRGGKAYRMETANIGKSTAPRPKPKSWDRLRREIGDMKELATPEVRTILTVINMWVIGRTSLTVCLEGVEEAIRSLSRPNAMKVTRISTGAKVS